MTLIVTTFYKFITIADPDDLRANLAIEAGGRAILGTMLVAREGINATLSGAPDAVATFMAWLRADPRFSDLASKEQIASAHPFRRLKVKVKREIVMFGAPEANPAKRTGTYVRPEHWNALISDPGVVVLDTRNAYEVEMGSFPGAVDPGTRTFSEFRDFAKTQLNLAEQPRVAMFCTGGIRCEKASAYLLSLGFPEVYHLQGGILKYLETIPPEQSLWRGGCFVFDERGSVAPLPHRVQ